MILETHSKKKVPRQAPALQNPSSHSALVPHLQIPDSQVSDVLLEHLGFTPHIQSVLGLHVSDSPVQSSFPEHTKKSIIQKMSS